MRSHPRWVRLALLIAVALVVLSAVVAVGIYTLPSSTATSVLRPVISWLSDADPLPDQLPSPDQRSVVLAADGSLLATLAGEEERTLVALDAIPGHVVDAVLAIEDARFRDHAGIDHRGIMRAAVANLRSGEVSQGGSTISQQLIDLTVLADGRSLDRKVDEAWLALQLEEQRTKGEILRRYLNEVYLGNGVYGVAAAAERYFSAPVQDLTVSQGALLAGMIAAPEAYDPLADPDRARARRDVVLDRMVDEGMLDGRDRDAAADADLALDPMPPAEQPFPFLVDIVLADLLDAEELGDDPDARRAAIFRGGLQVTTTFDLDGQRAARQAIAHTLPDPAADPQATVLSVDPVSGAVRVAAVGPDAHGDCPQQPCTATRVNPAVPGLGGSGRQPGSAFKPVVLAAALAVDVPVGLELPTPSGAPIPACPTDDGPYRPENYSGTDGGMMDMREAIRESNNAFHARLTGLIGPGTVRTTAEQLGFAPDRLPEGCAIALGAGSVYGLEMAVAYATFLNDGIRCRPHVVEAVVRRGAEVERHEPTCTRVVDSDDAARLADLLTEPLTSGTAVDAAIDRPAIAKTGTTDDNRDAWLVGGVPQLVTAAWIGFEEPRPLRDIQGVDRVTGGSLPADLWRRYMGEAVADLPGADLPDAPPPPGRVTVPDFVGGTASTAEEAVSGFDLVLTTRTVTEHPPRGRVVDQQPAAGSRVERGSRVVLRVSDGRGEPPPPPPPTDPPSDDQPAPAIPDPDPGDSPDPEPDPPPPPPPPAPDPADEPVPAVPDPDG